MDKKLLELVNWIMDVANGIDDYNWGQDKFKEELTEKLSNLISKNN